jgi:hypothetical protein
MGDSVGVTAIRRSGRVSGTCATALLRGRREPTRAKINISRSGRDTLSDLLSAAQSGGMTGGLELFCASPESPMIGETVAVVAQGMSDLVRETGTNNRLSRCLDRPIRLHARGPATWSHSGPASMMGPPSWPNQTPIGIDQTTTGIADSARRRLPHAQS